MKNTIQQNYEFKIIYLQLHPALPKLFFPMRVHHLYVYKDEAPYKHENPISTYKHETIGSAVNFYILVK